MAQCTLVEGAMHSGKKLQSILVKSDDFENSFSLLYILLKSCLCCCSLATLAPQQKEESQEPITGTCNWPHIPITVLLQTNPLLVWIYHKSRPLPKPQWPITNPDLNWNIHFFSFDNACSRNVCMFICDLFTHGTPRSSLELVQKCPYIPRSNWNLETLVFEERG